MTTTTTPLLYHQIGGMTPHNTKAMFRSPIQPSHKMRAYNWNFLLQISGRNAIPPNTMRVPLPTEVIKYANVLTYNGHAWAYWYAHERMYAVTKNRNASGRGSEQLSIDTCSGACTLMWHRGDDERVRDGSGREHHAKIHHAVDEVNSTMNTSS